MFKRIEEEQNGQLDVLVNNAYAGVSVSTLKASANKNAIGTFGITPYLAYLDEAPIYFSRLAIK